MNAPLRGLTPEQVLSLCDALTAQFNCQVVSFSAVAAIAGATSAVFEGISPYRDAEHLAKEARRITLLTHPLDSHNEILGDLVYRVLLELNP